MCIRDRFKDIIAIAIAGPVMKWLANPKNTEALKNIVEGMVKFFGFVAKFLTDRVIGGLEGLRKLIEGNWWEKIVGLFQMITNFAGLFIAIRWLKNPMKLVKDLRKLFKVFAKGLKNLEENDQEVRCHWVDHWCWYDAQ